MDRVNRLGGTENVLSIPTNEVKTKLAGPAIERTPEEAKSYFSKTVAQMPLTAILTTEEINAIAARMVQVQQATQLVAMKRTVPPADQVKPDPAPAQETPEPADRSDKTAGAEDSPTEPTRKLDLRALKDAGASGTPLKVTLTPPSARSKKPPRPKK